MTSPQTHPAERETPAGEAMREAVARPAILLASGRKFEFAEPGIGSFTVGDIAQGLSMLCRFAGQCRQFYSVAQHSVLVSRIVPPEDAYAGLMHDAAEAFLGDVSKPLKGLLPDYQRLEKSVEAAIFPILGAPVEIPASVKQADLIALATEQHLLMPDRVGRSYAGGYQPLGIDLPEMTWREAKAAFLARYEEVRPYAASIPPVISEAMRDGGEVYTEAVHQKMREAGRGHGRFFTVAQAVAHRKTCRAELGEIIASELARLTAERDEARDLAGLTWTAPDIDAVGRWAEEKGAAGIRERMNRLFRRAAAAEEHARQLLNEADRAGQDHATVANESAEAALTTLRADHAAEVARLKAQRETMRDALKEAGHRLADIAGGKAFQPRLHAATGHAQVCLALAPKETTDA